MKMPILPLPIPNHMAYTDSDIKILSHVYVVCHWL